MTCDLACGIKVDSATAIAIRTGDRKANRKLLTLMAKPTLRVELGDGDDQRVGP